MHSTLRKYIMRINLKMHLFPWVRDDKKKTKKKNSDKISTMGRTRNTVSGRPLHR